MSTFEANDVTVQSVEHGRAQLDAIDAGIQSLLLQRRAVSQRVQRDSAG